jgi:hypothetical protein
MELAIKISIIAAYAATASALVSFLMLFRMRRAEKAHFFLEITSRYNSQEMQDALQHLVIAYRSNSVDFTQQWVSQLNNGDNDAQLLNSHRRRVNRYFSDVAKLYSAGYIDRHLTGLLVDLPGLDIFVRIVVPMTQALYDDSQDLSLKTFAKLRTQHGRGNISFG